MNNNNQNETAKPSDLVTFTIVAAGSELNKSAKILSLEITRHCNKIASAKINIADGDPAVKDFAISSKEESLLPGNDLEIRMGYHSKSAPVFKGVIVKQSLRALKNKTSYLTIEARDKFVKLTAARSSKCYANQTDTEIIEAIASRNGFRNTDLTLAGTNLRHKEMVQFNVTDWDFILTRAEMNGMVLLAQDNKLVMASPTLGGDPQKEITYGTDVTEFESQADGRTAINTVKGHAWNYKDQSIEDTETTDVPYKDPAVTYAEPASDPLGIAHYDLFHAGNLNTEELQGWGRARLMKSRLAKRTGRIRIKGNNDLQPGQIIMLKGFGKRFNGKAYVSGITHNYDKSIWETDIFFGLTEPWFYETAELMEKPASGLVPGVNGLQLARVMQIDNDPDGEDRIKIQLPLVDAQEGIWARVASLDAGNQRGTFFRPEINDEVIVGFIDDDPRHPVVLGMLHSSARPAPLKAKDSNPEKGFVTRSKMKLLFDDEKKSISIDTPKGKKITISENDDSMSLSDEHGNRIVMDAQGITIESKKDIMLKSGSGNISTKGNNIEQKATGSFTASGNSGAQISSSGITAVKGSMVNIN